MTIITQGTIPPAAAILDDIAKQCSEEENAKEAKAIKGKKKKRSCQKLGIDKHACCEKKIQEHQKNGNDPALEGEKGYNRPTVDKATRAVSVDKTPLPGSRADTIRAAIVGAGAGASRKAISKAIGKALAGKVFPDAAIVGPPKQFVDFKFACPPSHRKKTTQGSYKPPSQSARQEAAHNLLGDDVTITILH